MIRLFLVAIVTAVLAATPVLAQETPHSDHYLSYRVEPRTAGATVDVNDKFIPHLTVTVTELERLLNPVSQDGSAFVDSTAHLDWWRVTPNPSVNRRIAVVNKFGQFVWDIGTLEFILAPSRKNTPGIPPPDNINHFLCYRAVGPTPNEVVVLRDQFQQFTTQVGAPRYFCNACRKRHGGNEYPILDPELHLAVYEVLPPTFTAPVLLVDQFGPVPNQDLVVSVPPEYLFVPAFKDEPVPVGAGTWGQIKSIYRREGAANP